MTPSAPPARRQTQAIAIALFLLIAVAGLFYVKWQPYFGRALTASASHSIGASILMGQSASAPPASWTAAVDYAVAYGKAIWKAMVLGLVLGAAVDTLLPADWVPRFLGRRRVGSVVAGSLLGLPAMMCTCCAAPVVAGLRRGKASPGGAVAFWLSNTVLNPATLVFTGFVLGWHWMGLRLALGLVLVLGMGVLVDRITPADASVPLPHPATTAQVSGRLFQRWFATLWRMAVRLLPEYAVLVLLLGAARAWLFPHVGPEIGNQLPWIVLFALAGTAFVIPTAGEVAIVQAMLALGIASGPAAVLLLTLPPVSLPSLAMLQGSLSLRTRLAVAAGVVAMGILAGLAAIACRF